jgi:hypothetical protein
LEQILGFWAGVAGWRFRARFFLWRSENLATIAKARITASQQEVLPRSVEKNAGIVRTDSTASSGVKLQAAGIRKPELFKKNNVPGLLDLIIHAARI